MKTYKIKYGDCAHSERCDVQRWRFCGEEGLRRWRKPACGDRGETAAKNLSVPTIVVLVAASGMSSAAMRPAVHLGRQRW